MLARSKRRSQVAVNPALPVNWQHPLNRNLVAWYKLLPNAGFRGGIYLRDIAANPPRNATLNNITLYKDMTSYNGSSSYAKKASSSPLNVSPPVTLFAVAIANTSHDGAVFDIRTTVSDYAGYDLSFRAASSQLRYYCRGNSATDINVLSTSSYTTGALTYFGAVSYSATDHRIFVNGIQQNTSATNVGIVTTDTVSIGRYDTMGFQGEYLNGYVRDCLAFKRALSPAEMYEYYIEARNGYPNTLNWLGTKTYSFKSVSVAATTGRLASFYAQFQVG